MRSHNQRYGQKTYRFMLCVLLTGIMLICSLPAQAAGRSFYIAPQLAAAAGGERQLYAAESHILGESALEHDTMSAINGDYVGWLKQEGTPIDYPIAQAGDNKFYMYHSFKLEDNRAGCLFLDYRNKAPFSDANCVVYGHHMKDKSMLAALINYETQEYYDANPIMKLYTPCGDYDIEIFSGIVASGAHDFLKFNFESKAEFDEYWQPFIENSTFKSDVRPEFGDRIITLITCTYEFDNARYIVCGRMLPTVD